MPRRRTHGPTALLTPEMKALLLRGPESIGGTWADVPPMAELQQLWTAHRVALTAALPKGRKPWIAERLWLYAITMRLAIPPGC
jgi:hypothetical protein